MFYKTRFANNQTHYLELEMTVRIWGEMDGRDLQIAGALIKRPLSVLVEK